MTVIKESLAALISKNGYILRKELDELFAELTPISAAEITGEWRIGYLFTREGTGSIWEAFIRRSPIRLYSKVFISINNVKAWVFRFCGVTFSIPGTGAILKRIDYRNKESTSMVYNYLPLIDNFRKLDDFTIVGVMEVKGIDSVYFYLYRVVRPPKPLARKDRRGWCSNRQFI